MALNWNASGGDSLKITSNFPSKATYTLSMWVKRTGSMSDFIPVFYRNNAGDTSWHGLGTSAATDNTWILETDLTSAEGSAWALGVWQHIALTKSGADMNFYIDGTLDITISSDPTFTEANLFIGDHLLSVSFLNASIYAPKMWDAVLSATELAMERLYARAVRRTNLVAEWSLLSSAALHLADMSGNGRNLALAGTLIDVNEPNIKWQYPYPREDYSQFPKQNLRVPEDAWGR